MLLFYFFLASMWNTLYGDNVLYLTLRMNILKFLSGNGGRQEGPNLACLVMLSQLMIQHLVPLSQHLVRGKLLNQYLLYLWVHHLLLSTHNLFLLRCNHQLLLPRGELHHQQRERSLNQYVYLFII